MELIVGKTWTVAPNGTYYLYGGPNSFNDSEWNEIVFSEIPKDGEVKWDNLDNPPDQSNDSNTNTGLTIKPLGDGKPDGQTLRYPNDAVDATTDYVFFQFGKYMPPFSEEANKLRQKRDEQIKNGTFEASTKEDRDYLVQQSNRTATRSMYESSIENLELRNETIMLPMPQDLSNEINQQWQGKQFTATGRAAVAALAAGQFSYASEVVKNIAGNASALQTAFNTTVLNTIPGVGGNLEFNDVSGSTRGIVINPNAELLYDSPEMREVGMIFRLVPRNKDEAGTIKEIIRAFRRASMPRWGGLNVKGEEGNVDLTSGEVPTTVGGGTEEAKKSQINLGGRDNWIQVPDLCKFTFMTGSNPNENIIQFKPCAISGVEVNYTPDGTYAAYASGVPVAIELRLNFMETKLIFADEVGVGY
tara:strand:+ start:336 stop:1586 length:1251 start_codon:yes stop_codon:yes gene_type:complete